MVVKIRLSRFGRKYQPIYNIVVMQARSARDSRPLEVLGTYDPKPKKRLASEMIQPLNTDPSPSPFTNPTNPSTAGGDPSLPTDSALSVPKPKKYKNISLDQQRAAYWLGVGAQPSESVEKMFCMIGLMVPRPGKMSRAPLSAS